MNTPFIRTFAMLFGATIALICAVYVWIGYRRKLRQQPKIEEVDN
jgi:hypothetical protein